MTLWLYFPISSQFINVCFFISPPLSLFSFLLKFLTLDASPKLPVPGFWPWPVQGSCVSAVPSVISGSALPICLAADSEPLGASVFLFYFCIIQQHAFSSEVTLKGPCVMFFISALSGKSCHCIYQRNHQALM